MPNFDKNASDLPTTDKDGSPITEQNPLTLEDVLVRAIERSDPVLGLPVSGLLNAPGDSPLNWALMQLFLRDIFLDSKVDEVAGDLATFTLPEASTTVAGVIELLTQTESRRGTDTKRALTVALLLDFLRNGTGAGASTTHKGTVELATKDEAETATATSLVLTAKTGMDQLRSLVAQATETLRGTAERATKKEAEDAVSDTHMMTPLKTENYFDSKVWIGTQAQFNALTSKPAGRLHFIT